VRGGQVPAVRSADRAASGRRGLESGRQRCPASVTDFLRRVRRPGRTGTGAPACRTAWAPVMPYTPIVATLGYGLSPDRGQVLMIHRNARPGDHHLGKYNGLGGKIERDEDVVSGMRREIREEAGIECGGMALRGTISWPGFGKHGEDWLGFIFLVTRYSGTPLERNHEGTLEWVPVAKLHELPMWERSEERRVGKEGRAWWWPK